MHELPITERILSIVLAYARRNQVRKVVTVNLCIGAFSDLEEEWLQHYFNYLAKDTVAAEAIVKIKRVPALIACKACTHTFEIDIRETSDTCCPQCGEKRGTLLSGREYTVENLEVV